jgi:hypothetical protein
MADWDVSRELCQLLAEGHPFGIRTLSQAALVVQHCSVKGISLLEFGQQFRLDGFELAPANDPHEFAPSDLPADVDGEQPAQAAPARRKRSRKLFDEPQVTGADVVPAAEIDVDAFMRPENIVIKTDVDESPEPKFEDAQKVAALLGNPEPPQTPPAVNERGQLLCSEDQLREIYRLGEKLGMSRVEVDAGIQQKSRVRVVSELTSSQAKGLIAAMAERVRVKG